MIKPVLCATERNKAPRVVVARGDGQARVAEEGSGAIIQSFTRIRSGLGPKEVEDESGGCCTRDAGSRRSLVLNPPKLKRVPQRAVFRAVAMLLTRRRTRSIGSNQMFRGGGLQTATDYYSFAVRACCHARQNLPAVVPESGSDLYPKGRASGEADGLCTRKSA